MEGNKLIAEFMGRSGKLCDTLYTFKGVSDLLEDDIWYTIEQSKFHTSWDWLIPVIDKITSDDSYMAFKNHTNSMVVDGGIYINTKFIGNTYRDVVDFINWYNQKP